MDSQPAIDLIWCGSVWLVGLVRFGLGSEWGVVDSQLGLVGLGGVCLLRAGVVWQGSSAGLG